MTQLEIATQIFCSGKGYTIDESWTLAGGLMLLEALERNTVRNTVIKNPNAIYPLTPDEAFDISQRTADRTQQLIDLGFEWNEENDFFEKEKNFVKTHAIESFSDDDWNIVIIEPIDEEDEGDEGDYYESILPVIISEKTPEELIKKLNEQPIQFVPNDFFKGKPYIEFEMKNTNLRLYNMDKQLEAEKDLDSKRIVMASENKEFELGITIFKK